MIVGDYNSEALSKFTKESKRYNLSLSHFDNWDSAKEQLSKTLLKWHAIILDLTFICLKQIGVTLSTMKKHEEALSVLKELHDINVKYYGGMHKDAPLILLMTMASISQIEDETVKAKFKDFIDTTNKMFGNLF